jgi:hypothetical protein
MMSEESRGKLESEDEWPEKEESNEENPAESVMMSEESRRRGPITFVGERKEITSSDGVVVAEGGEVVAGSEGVADVEGVEGGETSSICIRSTSTRHE